MNVKTISHGTCASCQNELPGTYPHFYMPVPDRVRGTNPSLRVCVECFLTFIANLKPSPPNAIRLTVDRANHPAAVSTEPSPPPAEACPNCDSRDAIRHSGHDAISEPGDPSEAGHRHCLKCNHIWPVPPEDVEPVRDAHAPMDVSDFLDVAPVDVEACPKCGGFAYPVRDIKTSRGFIDAGGQTNYYKCEGCKHTFIKEPLDNSLPPCSECAKVESSCESERLSCTSPFNPVVVG